MPRTLCRNFPTGQSLPIQPSRSAQLGCPITAIIGLVVAMGIGISGSTMAQQPAYRSPQVHPLADPFGRDAPPAGGMAPDLRPDPIPAYRDFPQRWKLMQQQTCQPLFNDQTGRTTAWRCRMSDGTILEIR